MSRSGNSSRENEWKKWKEKLTRAQPTFEESQLSSRSLAHMFGDFCSFSDGIVLDVGCGPKKGAYMCSSNLKALVGLDPLPVKPKGMDFVRGVGESLPFRSSIFDQSVCSTTLDHCLNPVMVLREMKRVTAGRINLWTSIDQRRGSESLFKRLWILIAARQFRRVLKGIASRSISHFDRMIGQIKHGFGLDLDSVRFYDIARSRYHVHYFGEGDLLRILAESKLETKERRVIGDSVFLTVS